MTVRARREQSGQTLSEMVVVMAIVGVILSAFATALSMSIRQSSQLHEQSTLQTEVRAAVDSLAAELRQAYTGDATFPIETATATTLQFLSPDKATPFHDRRIAYRLLGGQLSRALTTSANTDGPPWTGFAWSSFGSIPASAWSTEAGSVVNSAVFAYYDQTGVLLTGTIVPASVFRVKITITVATGAAPNRQFSYATSASLRWTPT
jgi:prepilin-type N-terminal cleavage/methylation domain-containing protein